MRPASRSAGFTLIEMMVALLIFSSVMFASYEILDVTLRAERIVTEATLFGEVGQAILTQMRRDLQGAIYQDLGRRVFRGEDRGDGDSAEDSLHFLTTAPVPLPPDDFRDAWDGEIASVGYLLKRDGDHQILFRRVNWKINEDELGAEGHYYPIYDKVKALSIRYFDGKEWYDTWNSEDHIPAEPQDDAADADGDGTPDPDPNPPPASPPPAGGPDPSTPIDPNAGDAADDKEEIIPLPRSVEVALSINIGDEKGLIEDADGKPLVERYVMIIPLIVTDRLDLQVEDLLPTPTAGH